LQCTELLFGEWHSDPGQSHPKYVWIMFVYCLV